MTARHRGMRPAGLGALTLAALLLATSAAAESTRLTFLHINDVYEIAPRAGKGGFAPLMTLLRAERAANPNNIFTFGGDLISPSVMSGLTKGTQMIELMNAVGAEVAVPGNHEFDFGPEVAAARIAESDFVWIGTNVLGPDGEPAVGLVRNHIVELGGYKVGFFGLLAPETDTLASPGPEITFAPLVETARTAVADLRAEGAEVIVALTHIDLADDRALIREVPGIHLILGGHDHDPITVHERDVLIVKAGFDAHYLAVVDLDVQRVRRQDRTVVEVLPSWRYLSTAGVAPDAEIQALVEGYEAWLDEELDVPVGTTAVGLDSRRAAVRTEETNLGNLIADAIRAATGAQVGLTNGGGIRGDRLYEPGTTLTRKDVLTELPFGNVTVLIELSGADLLAALENGVGEVENGAGRFPQVSGLSFVYDKAAPKGSRVLEVQVGGQPLDPTAVYTVATNDYMFAGGDGYAALTRGRALIDASGGVLMASVVMDYITGMGAVAPQVEGRIRARN